MVRCLPASPMALARGGCDWLVGMTSITSSSITTDSGPRTTDKPMMDEQRSLSELADVADELRKRLTRLSHLIGPFLRRQAGID